jgi:threonine dehydrogenase-like Zn-dependent dehydrogenase
MHSLLGCSWRSWLSFGLAQVVSTTAWQIAILAAGVSAPGSAGPAVGSGRHRPRRSKTVRRDDTASLSGVYGSMADPPPMMSLFDKQIQLRMGQAYVKRWIPDIMPFLAED